MAITDKYVSVAGGGAHDGTTEADAFTWAEMLTDINAGGKAGNRYNVIAGTTYTLAATSTISGSGSATSPIIIRGYTTTIGDGYQGRTNSNGPLITTNMPLISHNSTFLLNVTGSWIVLESLRLTGFRSASSFTMTVDNVVTRCRITNSSTNALAVACTGASRVVICDNDIALTGGSGGSTALTTAGARVFCNRISGGPANGVLCSSNGSVIIDNVFYSCGGIAISHNTTNAADVIYGNTIVGSGGDAIDIVTGTTVLQMILNNLITDNAGYGIDGVSAANPVFASHNRLDRNTAGATNSATDWLAGTSYGHELTSVSQGDEFNNFGSDDFSLLSGSPAKDAGVLAFRDIGALQRDEAGGGSAGILVHPGMIGV